MKKSEETGSLNENDGVPVEPMTNGDSSASHNRSCSLAVRLAKANESLDEDYIWGVAATIVISLFAVHGLSYVIVEHGMFGGASEYFTTPKASTYPDNKFGMTGSAPTDQLNNDQFELFLGFVLYATVVFTGLGMEYLTWRMFLNGDWDEEKEKRWKIAQFSFSLLVATSIGLATIGNYFAMPLLVVAMWKLGFPETILFIYSALYEKENSFSERIIDFIRGVGTIVHHSSSALYVTMMLVHVLPPTPEILATLPPLLMQHWFVLLKYNHKSCYSVVETILEVWFEWTCFSVLEVVHEIHWIAGVILFSQLFAHWCYFGAGILSLVIFRKKDEMVTTTSDNILRVQQVASRRSLFLNPEELRGLNEEEEDERYHTGNEGINANGNCLKRSWIKWVLIAGVIAVAVPLITLAVKNSTQVNGNHLCPSYCDLYAKAVDACPYYVSYYDPEAVKLQPTSQCIRECEEASFSKTDSDTSFESDSLQCRMNHARMAIKEGSLTNTMHCVHATINGPYHCNQSINPKESMKSRQQFELGLDVFRNPSKWLASDNPLGISEFQALLVSIYSLLGLRGRLYVAYPSENQIAPKLDCITQDLRHRSVDGTCNSITQPFMGAVGTLFTRNLSRSKPHKTGEADVAQVASIMKRDVAADGNKVAPYNQLTSAWIQFMTHDWFQHDEDEPQGPNMKNTVTHWWDASQIYGSSQEEVTAVRVEGGKLLLDENDEVDYDEFGVPITGFRQNWWPGLHILHTIFAREHNYLVDILSDKHPSMTDDELFGTVRNIIAAILAKIHVLEWVPTLLDNKVSTMGLHITWYGLRSVVENFFRGKDVPDEVEDIIDEVKVPSVLGGGYSTDLTSFNTPFYMTEEFVSVYRMHSLLPDRMKVEGRTLSLQEMTFNDARSLVTNKTKTTETWLWAFAHTPAGTLSLKNYPRSLYNIEIGNGDTINLAEIDITRDRERGIPRYNDARRQLLLPPYKRIDDLTTDEEERQLLKSVYADIEQVDFLVGCLVDQDRPEGFAFGIVPYYIFVVMATRRIVSDRFFQEGLTEENYSESGIQYIMDTTFQDILQRQYPGIKNGIPENPFSNEWAFGTV